MPISRELALKILRYLLDNPSFYFPFKIVCINFDELYDIEISKEMLDEVFNNDDFKDFELVEDLQCLDLQTLQLMSKGFLDKIVNNDALNQIETYAKEYRNLWKKRSV